MESIEMKNMDINNNYDNTTNANLSIKISHSANTSVNYANYNLNPNKNNNNTNINFIDIPNKKYIEFKLPYFFSLALSILINFLKYNTSIENANHKYPGIPNNKNINNELRFKNLNNTKDTNSGKNFLSSTEFNPFNSDNSTRFLAVLDKTFFFMLEILSMNLDIIGKLKKINGSEICENDFNDRMYKFFVNSEISTINETINFFHKILFHKNTERILKRKIIYFFFDNFQNIFRIKKDTDRDTALLLLEKSLPENYLLKDESLLNALITFLVEALSEQYYSKADELYENISLILEIIKRFIDLMQKNKQINFNSLQYRIIKFMYDKVFYFIPLLEEKIKQIKLQNESIRRIINQQEKII